MLSTQTARMEWSLFFLRVSVFVVMCAWTIDKFVRPDHASKVFERFYFIEDIGATPMMIIGVIEVVIILGFLLGIAKRGTYGLVLTFHAISTLSSWRKYTVDINLLFFAAWPMLAACVALYLLRDLDTKFTVSRPD